MSNKLTVVFSILFYMMLFIGCNNRSDKPNASVNQSEEVNIANENQPYHDPLKIGYPFDIEKTDVVKQVEEILTTNIALADSFSENDINEQVDSLFQQATSTPGVEPVPIKDENEVKLVRKYFREYLLTNYILNKCQLNNMISSQDRQRLSEKYCRFMVLYYNNAFGLSLPLGPEKP